jgi:hypothetical protein
MLNTFFTLIAELLAASVSIEGVEVGQTYIVWVLAKNFQFTPRAVAVNEELLDLDMIALP